MYRLFNTARRQLSEKALKAYEAETFLASSPSKYVLQLTLNRPEAKNAMNQAVWDEMELLFNTAHKDPNVRAIVLTSTVDENSPVFSAGIDIGALSVSLMKAMESDDVARRFIRVREMILDFQKKISAAEACRKPVIAAISGACVGGAIDLLSACDIRYCDQSAWYTIKEVDVGLAADVGTLQRMVKVCGNESTIRELAMTGRNFDHEESKEIGFVSSVALNREEMMDRVYEVAATIAEKSPVAVQGTKVAMNYARDHSIAESLEQIATWNGACLLSEDLMKSALAMKDRKGPADLDYEDC